MAVESFQQAGAKPPKDSHYAPLFIAASLTGMYTQRHVFHDPSNVVTQKFYGGRPDALFNGENIELTNRLTLQPRPGFPAISAVYSDTPDNIYWWQDTAAVARTMVDTVASVTFGGVGTGGRVVLEPLDGSAATLILNKNANAGLGAFVASGDVLYYGNGIDLIKYTPGNPNGLTWKWGIAAPTMAPSVSVVDTGDSAVAWEALSVFSTMGLLVDVNGNVQQLFGVNADPNNANNTQFGTSSNGTPTFNTAYNATTSDGGVTWTSLGAIQLWAATTTFQPGEAIYDPGTNCIFIASHSYPVTTGANRPNFTATLGLSGARVTESSGARWENIGPCNTPPTAVLLWKRDTAYAHFVLPASGNDPTLQNSAIAFPLAPFIDSQGLLCGGQTTFLLGASTAGTTANTAYTPWTGVPSQSVGDVTVDGQLEWVCLGASAWAANNQYTAWMYGNAVFSTIKDANGNMQVAIVSGNSAALVPGTVATLTAASNSVGGNTTYTGTFPIPYVVGLPATIAGFTNAGNNKTGQVVSCTGTTLVIVNATGVAETHAGTATFNPWGSTYGAQTADGSVTWVCVGPPVPWAATTKWFLPAPGFAPPLPTQQFGGAQVIGSSFVQACTSSGISGSPSAPTWPVTVGDTVSEGAGNLVWTTAAAYQAQSITWTKSHVYAYSLCCRAANDPYVDEGLLLQGALNTQAQLAPLGNVPGLTSELGAYLGGGTNCVSTASPFTTLSTPNTEGAVNVIGGFGSTDPQVDTIVIWRDADGGGPSNMLELIRIPAPKPIRGRAQAWTFKDYLPDLASTVNGINFPGLDILSPAPINGANNPPPPGFRPLCPDLHFSRIWGASGDTVFNSGGPDTLVGNPNEAFDPDDDYPFKSTVVACIHSPAGLLVPTVTDWECIYGGPSTSTFFSQNMVRGIGLFNFNSWDRVGGEIYFISPDGQLWTLNPSTQVARPGFAVGDAVAELGMSGLGSSIYFTSVVAHESGTDNAIYMGLDGDMLRLNPHQVGADTAGENMACWSTFYNTDTAHGSVDYGVMKSVYAPSEAGVKTLLVAAAVPNKPIMFRNPNTNLDYVTPSFTELPSEAWCDIGAITLASPGQWAALRFLEFDFGPIPEGNTVPEVFFALDNPLGEDDVTWTLMVGAVPDPPIKYGATPPTAYNPCRYYFSATASLAVCRRIRIKILWGNQTWEPTGDNFSAELVSFAIFGRKYQEM